MASRCAMVCPLCSNVEHLILNFQDLIKHLNLFHAHQPDFKVPCGIVGCSRHFTNLRTYQNHMSSVHNFCENIESGVLEQDSSEVVDCFGDENENYYDDTDDDNDMSTSTVEISNSHMETAPNPEELLKSSALFLLGLKEKYKLTQVSVQGIINGVTSLTQQNINFLQSQVYSTLTKAGISPSEIEGLDKCFSDTSHNNPFLGIDTQYRQIQFFKTRLDLIEPTAVLLGERRIWKGSGTKRKCVSKQDNFYYIPILQTLQNLLKSPAVLSEIENGHKSLMSTMQDYCDGDAFCSSSLYSVHPEGLQIFFYFDELEVCNPLGSKATKHKLGMFYFTLGNLSPKYRSHLPNIQLVAIAKSAMISSYGMDRILQPFVDDVKKLEKGVEFFIDGKRRIIFGGLAVVSADNLGSLLLGGFKESCTALKMCRFCMATKEDSQTKFHEKQFELRNKQSHEDQCSQLESDTSGETSKQYGINRNSVLNQLSYFHVCDGSLLPDVMHDILEGLLQYEMKLLLHVMIEEEGYFSLDYFNSCLDNLELGYMESKSRPTLISVRTFRSAGNSLKQTASQMWLLGRVLPLIIGDYVPDDDEHWMLFLRLMEVVDLLFAPQLTEDHVAYLSALISDHHHDFSRLYSSHPIIPKMHFMVHMPRLIMKFGPLVRHWTMRFEAKHSYFKQLAHSMNNFINLPYSLSLRHQEYQCYLNATTNRLHGSVDDIDVGPGSCVSPEILRDVYKGNEISGVFRTKWVKTDGVEYKVDAGVILDVHEDDLPVVGCIRHIYVVDNTKVIFDVTKYTTTFEPHFRAYLLSEAEDTTSGTFVFQTELFLRSPVHVRKSQVFGTNKYIILPHAVFALY